MRVLVGFAVAPALPAVLLYLLGSVFAAGNAFVFPLVLGLLAYLAATILGVPLYLALKSRGITGVYTYVIGGFLLGVMFGLIINVIAVLVNYSASQAHAVALLGQSIGVAIAGGLYGCAASLAFWLLAIRKSHKSAWVQD